jgi:hypothetical protein
MDQSKKDVPLFRVHNSVLPEDQATRPVITYYRVNGNPGKLEEAFKIAANKDSKYSAGPTYEQF